MRIVKIQKEWSMGVVITTILNINQSLLYAWITEVIKTSIYFNGKYRATIFWKIPRKARLASSDIGASHPTKRKWTKFIEHFFSVNCHWWLIHTDQERDRDKYGDQIESIVPCRNVHTVRNRDKHQDPLFFTVPVPLAVLDLAHFPCKINVCLG